LSALIEIVLPVFALVALGRFAAWRRLLPATAAPALTAFVFQFALPPLLFQSVAFSDRVPVGGAVLFIGAAVAIFALGVALSRMVLREDLANAGVFGLNCAFGNSVMMGVPVVAAAFGREGVAELLAIIALHSAVLMPLATATVEAGLNAKLSPHRLLRATLATLVRNPIILAIVLGFGWSLLAWPMPAPLLKLLDLLAGSATPVALFVLGLSLPAVPKFSDLKAVALSTLVKNFLMPALVFGAARLLGLSPLTVSVATVTAAMPTGANAFMLASRYGTAAERSASAVLVSTAVSLPVLSLLLVQFRQ
jgi:predicted permease